MGDDQSEVVGKWRVQFRKWVWEYTFGVDGSVSWRDPLNDQNGAGRWTKTGKLINLAWMRSSTVESWNPPGKQADKRTGWVSASYGSGPLTAQRVAASPRNSTIPGISPEIAKIPWDPGYVDMFLECTYDVNYKIPPDKSFAFSSILQVKYSDGAAIELDIEKDFSPQEMTASAARDAMVHGTLGRGRRIFPAALTYRTTPRLWAARMEAHRVQNEAFKEFANISFIGVCFALSVPAMPAGAMAEEAVAATAVKRRSLPATKVPPAPIQGNMVRLGPGNEPGSLWAYIQTTGREVIYRVEMIVLEGNGPAVATARATHREMIKRSAQAAQAAGQRQFKMLGIQANPNFVRHADQLAREIGVAGSGAPGTATVGYPNYEVILLVSKALGLP